MLIGRLPEASVQLGEVCNGVANVGSVAVATFESGFDIEADIVIGADGIRSRVRQILFNDDKPRYTGQLG